MLTRITIHGLGPYAEPATHEIDPDGVTEITGPSEAGKSTLIDAACLALLGVDAAGSARDLEELITDGAPRAEIELVTKKGTTIRRTRTREGDQVRAINDAEFTREEDLARRLRDPKARFGIADTVRAGTKRAHVARLIMAPLAWCDLANGPGGGGPLRDALDAVTDDSDEGLRGVVNELMGGTLRNPDARNPQAPADSTDPVLAEEQRTKANRDAAAAAEGLSVAESPTEPEPTAPDPAKVEAARALLVVADAHVKHDAAALKWRDDSTARRKWQDSRQKLGDRPPAPDLSGLAELRHSVEVAEAELRHAVNAVCAAEDNLERAEAQHRVVAAMREHGDTCQHCKRPGWTEAAAALAKAEAALPALDPLRTALDAATAEQARRVKLKGKAADKLAAAENGAHPALAAVAKYDAALLALGPEPADPGDRPAPPPETRPQPAEVAAARAVITEADGHAARLVEHARHVAGRAARIEAATARLDAAKAEAVRCAALVDAVRRAPGVRLERSKDRLGDLGPVTLHPTATGIDVRIDGRHWRRASRGKLLLADLYLRCAIRRAAKLGFLPVFVDNRTDWSGDLPNGIGPAIVLRTVPEGAVGAGVERRVAK